ncbi:hypothetical protein, partial [Paenibacillus sp. Y412MC10]|uniref:hypothetical protein n=1 Tax=Geobacillus sp. (strain Y412MC10) TaxID=481743 RepID=UPI001C92FBCD
MDDLVEWDGEGIVMGVWGEGGPRGYWVGVEDWVEVVEGWVGGMKGMVGWVGGKGWDVGLVG